MALGGAELHVQDRGAVSAFLTNDGLACLSVAWPASEAAAFRADVEGNFLATLRLAPGLTEAVAAGERVRPFVGTADLPNFLRDPPGPGGALLGDPGCHKAPLLARAPSS